MALASALLALFTGAVVYLAGYFVGRRATKRPDRAICSCTHGYGTHDENGRCHGEIKRSANGYAEWVPCPCRRYDGPEMLSSFWVPPIAGGGD